MTINIPKFIKMFLCLVYVKRLHLLAKRNLEAISNIGMRFWFLISATSWWYLGYIFFFLSKEWMRLVLLIVSSYCWSIAQLFKVCIYIGYLSVTIGCHGQYSSNHNFHRWSRHWMGIAPHLLICYTICRYNVKNNKLEWRSGRVFA